jgi:hypothetical protein
MSKGKDKGKAVELDMSPEEALRELAKIKLAEEAVERAVVAFGDFVVTALASVADVAQGALKRLTLAKFGEELSEGVMPAFADLAINQPSASKDKK